MCLPRIKTHPIDRSYRPQRAVRSRPASACPACTHRCPGIQWRIPGRPVSLIMVPTSIVIYSPGLQASKLQPPGASASRIHVCFHSVMQKLRSQLQRKRLYRSLPTGELRCGEFCCQAEKHSPYLQVIWFQCTHVLITSNIDHAQASIYFTHIVLYFLTLEVPFFCIWLVSVSFKKKTRRRKRLPSLFTAIPRTSLLPLRNARWRSHFRHSFLSNHTDANAHVHVSTIAPTNTQ